MAQDSARAEWVEKRIENARQETTNPKRGRGMLSEADRRYLIADGDVDMSRQAQSERRKALRERVYNTILDFSLLAEHLDGEQIDSIFTHGDRNLESARRGFQDLHTFSYAAARRMGPLGRVGQGYEFHAKRGIEGGELKYFGRQSSVEIEIDAAPLVEPEVVYNHLDTGDYRRLSEAELMWVVKALMLKGMDGDDLRNLTREDVAEGMLEGLKDRTQQRETDEES